jgi:hypothetical protein
VAVRGVGSGRCGRGGRDRCFSRALCPVIRVAESSVASQERWASYERMLGKEKSTEDVAHSLMNLNLEVTAKSD